MKIAAGQLRTLLRQQPPDLTHHHDYDPMPGPEGLGAVKAAVLLPVILQGEPSLIFTRRTESLARHSGQVSFPGGRSEAGDLSPVETALRETFEETGIAASFVTVAGYLDRHLTGTGFDIQPVVGLLAGGFALTPDPREVAEIFEVPLAFLCDPANRRRQSREIGGQKRNFYTFTYQNHEIWGATAAIVVNLAERLRAINES
ncbi:MAG TPA: CoA pyrophosphatase [Rhizomicrobium sp.]|nr:CoA pyrophosphatase [Rhizomicrobium sp.]